MTRTRLLLAGLLCLIALPVFAQVSDTYVIPAVGKVQGGAGTNWLSDVYIMNPQRHALNVSVVFLPTASEFQYEVIVPVPANATAFIDDAVGTLFSRATTGSLLLATFPEDNPGVPDKMIDRAFLVNSKTFNSLAAGTFGQSIEGSFTGLFDFNYDQITAIATGVQNWGTNRVNGFRTNVGATNLGDSSVTMRVFVYDAVGNEVRNIPFFIPPTTHMQDALPVTLQGGSVEFRIEDDLYWNDASKYAVVFPYVSIVDNRTGDPIYVKPVLLADTGTLYGKGAKEAAAILQNPGRKLTLADARRVAERATSLGEVKLVLEDGKYVVVK
ncbi:MAG: hypothetical protein ACYC7A_07980 [Thermoanaerobaculia bacterium]